MARILANLKEQTRPPDEILAFCSNTRLDEFAVENPGVRFFKCPNRNDWGHAKRAEGVRLASSEWIGFFNHDDRYALDYLERMLARTDDNDVVYCAWNEIPNCGFASHSSTAGNFIVRTDLARDAGGWSGRRYEADGDFIEAVRSRTTRIARVDDVIYWHND